MNNIAIIGILSVVVLGTIAGAITYSEYQKGRPPHWESTCTKYNTYTTIVPISNGKTVMMVPQTHTTCAVSIRQCITGSNYRGAIKSCIGN